MASDYQGSSSPSFIRFGRSILSMKRDPDINYNHNQGHESTSQEQEVEAFQRHVTQRFIHLSSSHEFLSLSWVSNLLDVFLCCQEEFKAILFNNNSYMTAQPIDKLVLDYLERSVTCLDICNAIRDGIEQMRQWQKQLEMVSCVLSVSQKHLGEAQFRRAKKALKELAIGMMLDDKESSPSFAHRHRSFQKDSNHHKSLKQFRSLSWSVSRSWSASKQLEAIGNNIVPPKTANNSLAVAVYTMKCVLFFVMSALVAAIPCQDRGLQSHFNIPKSFSWGAPIVGLHNMILEESKNRARRNACGLLKEIQGIERSARLVNESMDSYEEKEAELRNRVEELGMVYEAIKNGLDPLEKQVREVFHGIVRIRTQGLHGFHCY